MTTTITRHDTPAEIAPAAQGLAAAALREHADDLLCLAAHAAEFHAQSLFRYAESLPAEDPNATTILALSGMLAAIHGKISDAEIV